MAVHTVDLEVGRNTLLELASRAHAGEPSLLMRHGKPYAAIVPPDALNEAKTRPRVRFLALRGTGKGLWVPSPVDAIAEIRDEWRADGLLHVIVANPRKP